MPVSDNAVGAILEIPPTLLADIQKAERYIDNLQINSKRAAEAVKTHWGEIATSGLDTFIRRLVDAQNAMKGVGAKPIELNINTQPFEQSMNNAANAAKKTTSDVSETVQMLAIEKLDFTNIDRLAESLHMLDATYKQVGETIKKLESGRESQRTESTEAQQTTNMIRLLKEYIELKKKSEEQLKTKTTVFDQTTLDQQKTTLTQMLQLQKDINAETVRQERTTKLGGTIPQEEIDRLRDYKERLDKLSESYTNLKTKIDEMSTAGQSKFNAEDVKYTLAMSREQTALEEKRGQALQMVSKYLSDIKLKSAGISSREEGIYMNEQVGVYRQMIDLIKKRGEVESQVASQGYAQTSAQTNLLQTISNEYARLEASLTNVTGKYAEIDRAVSSAFDKAKTMQEAENAAKLADAYQKVADAAEKKRKAEAKTEQTDLSKDRAEYKRVLALIEQIEKAQRRVNEALASATLPANLAQQLQSSQAAAEATLNNLYNRRAELESKRGQELIDIHQQNEVKKGAAAVAEHERAEKEKTRISKQEATDRYNEEMRQARLQNQALTAQGKQQRMTINDAKEQRAIELAQQRQKEVDRLRQEIDKLDKTDVNYQKDLDRLNQRINELLGTTQRRVSYTREEAMAMAKSASTLREYENAYKALKDAMATTNPKTKEWQEMNSQLQKTKTSIDEIKKKMGEFQSQASKTSNVMNQLQSRIAAAFSIGAINGFIKKMVEVRAQFELQRVALGAIIQDRDEANKIFTQVQNMALESPFSIMQLERATKQIAAFGFEAKKLVPTMKMFADISAGLGVEIDRLVLVMGHLKARGFLEGMMTRQFTNMGFNVLGELSKYYSELENKMVSVGEVQDRVKKKMVSFADVEEVLKRVTSAGGMFYDMQKKQSDSLWGQMQRIKDAYDLMLNEIGQSNESSIKGALTLIRTLINHWRALAPIIQASGAAIAIYFAVSRFSAIAAGVGGVVQAFRNMTTVIWGTKAAQDALNASQKANAWGLLASLIAAAVVAIYEYATAQSKLNESMDRVRNEGIGNMYDLIYQYQKLADTVRDTNKPYEEQKKALDEIKRIYADILPAEMLEIKNIKEMSDGYERATEAIKAYSAEKIKSNLKAEIENIVGKDIQSEENDLADWMATFLDLWDELPEKMPKDTFRSIAKTMIAEISEEVKNGSLPAEKAVDELKSRMVGRLNKVMPKGALDNLFKQLDGAGHGFDSTYWDDYMSTLAKFKNMTDGIDIGFEGAESDELVEVKNNYENLTKAVDEYKKAIEALRLAKEEGQIKGDVSQDKDGRFIADNDGQMGKKALDNLSDAYEKLKGQVERYGATWNTTSKDINAAIESQTGQMAYFEQTNGNVFGRILSGFSRWEKRFRDDDSVKAWVERTLMEADKLDLSDVQNKILGVALSVTSANGMQVKSLDKLRLASLNSFGDAAKAAQSVYNQLAQNEIAIQTQINTLTWYGYTAAKAKTMAEEQYGAGLTVDEIKELMKLYKELIPAFGGTFKDPNKSKSKSDKELKRWQDLKKAIEDVSTAYDKYRKSFTVEDSNKRIEELYGPVFKELNSDIKQFYKDGKYDAESMIKALESLKGITNATTEERKKFRSEIERKIGVTQVEIEVKMSEDAEKKLKSDLDEMFANYELTEELKKIGVSVDLTYMVGGKPTTLADIRREIARLRAEGGGKADAENRIKILEEQEKKLTQIELKEQKERLKNYEKYLKQMYSDRAKKMIEAYSTYYQMEKDFQKNIQQLESEMNAEGTTEARKKELSDLISSLRSQAKEASIGIQRGLQEPMAKADWNSFKGSEIFESMYQDLDTLSKKGIDALVSRLEEVRDKLQSVSDIDPKAVREVTQYIEKLKNAKINLAPYAGFKEALSAAKELKKEYGSIEAAQLRLVELNDSALGYEQEVADLETIISLLDRKVAIAGGDAATTARLNALYDKYKGNLQGALATARQNLNVTKEQASALGTTVNNAKKLGTAYQAQISKMQKYREYVEQITNAVFEIADALGGTVDEEWKNLASSIINAVFQGIQLQLQMQILQVQAQLLGVAMNSALGIIGWVAIALQVVASLLTAIFAAKDKRLQKKIEGLQDRADTLSKAFEKLEKSIERAFSVGNESRLTEQALDNLDEQRKAYEEMIRLEEAKKKTDDAKIKEYKDKLEELAEAEEELFEKRHEKWGSTNNVWDEANNWVDAWLDAYKETGDGLDALNDSWDEFYENLIKKQATSKVLGSRMDKYIQEINKAIDKNMSEYGYVDAFKEIGERFKKEFGDLNQGLIDFFNYAGIGSGSGELILSDLQKGIQNITEPQAAAIEAYLNSMRFAVFRHTEQLDTLIATIQMQYGGNAENPVVTELKGIRGVLDSIDRRLGSVINTQGRNATLRIGAN